MPHHFTKSTVEASVWCNKCNKLTPWRVADGRRQYCLTCYNKGAVRASGEKANDQPGLFDPVNGETP